MMSLRILLVGVCLIGCADALPKSAVEQQPAARQAVSTENVETLTPARRQAVDRLVQLTLERLNLMSGVALYKWNHQLPIEHREREQELLQKLVQQGTDAGVAENIISPFFANQFQAAKNVQQHFFDVWKDDENETLVDGPDLATVIRPEIDRISAEMIEQLSLLSAIWERPVLHQALNDAIDALERERNNDETEEQNKEAVIEQIRPALGLFPESEMLEQ